MTNLPAALLRATYREAEQMLCWGTVTSDQFDAYAYVWRDSAFRFSSLGQTESRRHAVRHSLPPALSDLTADALAAEYARRDAVASEPKRDPREPDEPDEQR